MTKITADHITGRYSKGETDITVTSPLYTTNNQVHK